MTGLEPRTSEVRSDRSTNYAATSLHHNKKVTSLQLVRSICGASMYTIV